MVVTFCADASQRHLFYIDTGEPFEPEGSDTFLESMTFVLGADGLWRASATTNRPADW